MDLSWFTTWLTKFNINDLPSTAILLMILFAAGRFLDQKLWPFIKDQLWPAYIKNQETRLTMEAAAESQRNTVMITLRDAVVEIKAVVAQLVAMNHASTSEQREVLNTLVAQQQAVMQKLGTVAVPDGGEVKT